MCSVLSVCPSFVRLIRHLFLTCVSVTKHHRVASSRRRAPTASSFWPVKYHKLVGTYLLYRIIIIIMILYEFTMLPCTYVSMSVRLSDKAYSTCNNSNNLSSVAYTVGNNLIYVIQ